MSAETSEIQPSEVPIVVGGVQRTSTMVESSILGPKIIKDQYLLDPITGQYLADLLHQITRREDSTESQ